MKTLFLKLTVVLLISALMLTTVGCELLKRDDDTTVDDNKDPSGNENEAPNKDALNAELALQVTEQGDYTLESYNAYLTKLEDAKKVADDTAATQESIDKAVADLTAARLALAVRPVEEVEGGNKEFRLISGDSKEIVLADYVNVNGLSKITYEVKTSNAVVELGSVADGKFTVTAGDVRVETDVTVSIIVSYDGAKQLTVELSVKITNDVAPAIKAEEVVKEYDLFDLENKESLVLDFAENVDNAGNLALTYSVKCGETDLVIDGSKYTLTLGSYTEEYAYQEYKVTVSYTANGEAGSLEYTYKLGLKDTSAYAIANGNFENGLEGWTIITDEGYEFPFGDIDDRATFWNEGYPMNNVGKYFSAYIGDKNYEAAQGTLASPYFTVKSDYATYMLGGAGNHNVYITIENKDGEILALYRNTKFTEFPADTGDQDKNAMIGNTVFLANFVTYKVDLKEWAGEEIRFVVHDHASNNWGLVFFDELNTYYASADEIPEDAILADNLLADKTVLNAEIALEVTEQGDYTEESYNAYVKKLAEAKAVANEVAAAQGTVDAAVAALSAAREALAVRPVLEVEDADKSFRLFSGNTQEIAIADYINENELSKITYEVKTNNAIVTLGSVSEGKFTITAGEVSEATVVTVSIIVSYDGVEKLTVNLTVNITNDLVPTVKNSEVSKSYDIYLLDNKESILVDFSENIDNPGNLELSYSINGGYITTHTYTYNFTYDYTENEIGEMFTVTVSYIANGVEGSISYEYVLNVKDTTKYRMENGGFENGLDGWTVVGNIGGISSDTHYWVGDGIFPEGYAFGMDGEKMFSAYAPGALESAVGTLTSPTFKVGGSGFVTFKVGGMKDGNYVYIDVIDADTKEILARYYNGNFSDETGSTVRGCTLVAYKADLSAFKGREVYFRISDNADSGYGLFFADSFVTYYEGWPIGDFNTATPVDYEVSGTIYDVFNGGFEMGNVQGWWNNGEIGVVTNASGFWGDNIPYNKDGDYLFTGVESNGADTMREGNRGALTSSVFEIGGTGYISFMLGGGENALCYVQVIDAVTGEVLARYHQQEMDNAVLKQYIADLSAYIGRTVRIQVVDQADSGWGCVSFDNVVTYYANEDSLPNGITAIDIKGNLKYTIDNGSFETGNIDGWTMNITEAGAHNTLGWVLETEIDADWYTKNDETKDGKFLLTFAQPGDINCENTKGTLQSSTFSLKQGSFVSFKFGGAGGAQNHDVYIELCRADGSVIARFYNDAQGKVNTKMNSYYYQYQGAEVDCFFRVVDNSTGDYGCFVVDDFRVNLESAPEGSIAAIQ